MRLKTPFITETVRDRPIIIIIIIIKSFINSAALKNSDALQAYVIQCCGTGVPSGVVQKL